jgi:hypothetical protein
VDHPVITEQMRIMDRLRQSPSRDAMHAIRARFARDGHRTLVVREDREAFRKVHARFASELAALVAV